MKACDDPTFAPTSYPTLHPTLTSPTGTPTVSPTAHPVFATNAFISSPPAPSPSPSSSPTSSPSSVSCADGVQNGDEADIDCGGACAPCGPGKGCRGNIDCSTAFKCQDHVCVTSTSSPTGAPTPVPVPPAVRAIEIAAAHIEQSEGLIGDGRCDDEVNSNEFGFDGGDCCRLTCIPNLFACPVTGFDCKDPVALAQDTCPVKPQKNGKCNVGIRNTLQCGYDSGDCCPDTCTGDRCSDPEVNGGWHHCKDPESAMLKGHVSQRHAQPKLAPGSARRLEGCIPQDGQCGGIEAGEQWAEPCCDIGAEWENEVKVERELFCFEQDKYYSQCLTLAGCKASPTKWCEVREACHAPQKTRLGDGICDPAPYNTPQCNYDGGDCCIITCRKLDGKKCESDTAFDCRNPDLLGLDSCVVDQPEYLGDGICDFEGGYNTVACGFDLGDCCETTCKGILCAGEWQHCRTSTVWTTEGSLSYLFFSDDGLSYDAMQARCEDVGGELARIDTAAQNAAALRLAGSSRAYIGLNDRESEGTWLWADGSAPATSSLAFLAAFTLISSSTCESRGLANVTKSFCEAAAFRLGFNNVVEEDTFDHPPGCQLSRVYFFSRVYFNAEDYYYEEDYYYKVFFNAKELSTISCNDHDNCICGSAKGILAYDTRIFFAPALSFREFSSKSSLLITPFMQSLFIFSLFFNSNVFHVTSRMECGVEGRNTVVGHTLRPVLQSFVFNSSFTIWCRLNSIFLYLYFSHTSSFQVLRMFTYPFCPSPAHILLSLFVCPTFAFPFLFHFYFDSCSFSRYFSRFCQITINTAFVRQGMVKIVWHLIPPAPTAGMMYRAMIIHGARDSFAVKVSFRHTP